MNEIATPPAPEATASEQPPKVDAANTEVQQPEKPENERKELTPLERELRRKDRRIDNLTRRLRQTEAQLTPLQERQSADTSAIDDSEAESLKLSRKELNELIDKRARELAPSVSQENAERERRRSIAQKLSSEWGQDKFDAFAQDLDAAFDGLTDNGKPKPGVDAIFESDDPRSLIEYLADPEHAAEAEALARMSAVQAGRTVAKLEDKLKAQRDAEKAKAKAEPSKAAPPIESARGGGQSDNSPRDSDSMDVWVRKERERVAALKGRR
jgi:hypothetical protein